MSDHLEIRVVVEPSLVRHFQEGLESTKTPGDPDAHIVNLIASILNGSSYPVASRITGHSEISISYHLRSFSNPIFD